jgi:hypothetical protein
MASAHREYFWRRARLAHGGKFEVRVLFGVGENGQLKNPKIRQKEGKINQSFNQGQQSGQVHA